MYSMVTYLILYFRFDRILEQVFAYVYVCVMCVSVCMHILCQCVLLNYSSRVTWLDTWRSTMG